MTTRQYPGAFTYPPVTTQYTSADGFNLGPPLVAGLLSDADTESLFNLDGAAPTPTANNLVKYVLPGVPYNYRNTPITRLLRANLLSGGSAIIVPPDYGAQPTPLLADFRGVCLLGLNAFARLFWNGSLWSLVDSGGLVRIVVADQSLDGVV